MIKVIPNKKKEYKCEPRYVLSVTLGIGDNCDDIYQYNTLTIVDSTKGIFDKWNYITTKEAEKLFTFFSKILQRKECDHITLNDAWMLHSDLSNKEAIDWYEDYMNETEIKKFSKFYEKYNSNLFNPRVDDHYNWYGIVGIHIFYYDENGVKYNCEVVSNKE